MACRPILTANRFGRGQQVTVFSFAQLTSEFPFDQFLVPRTLMGEQCFSLQLICSNAFSPVEEHFLEP